MLYCGTVHEGGGSKREQCCLLGSQRAFNHFLCYLQANWALLVLIPRCVVLCMFLVPMGLSNKLSCEAGSFSCCHNPHRFFQSEVLRLSFPPLEPWVAWSVLLHSCSSLFIPKQMWDHPLCQLPPHPFGKPPLCQPLFSSRHLAASPLCPDCHLHPSYRSE